MFTWICPKCGKEVPPAYNDCPNCAATAKSPENAGASPVAAPPAPPVPVVERQGRSISPVAVMLMAVAVIAGLLAVLYLYVLPSKQVASVATPAPLQPAGAPGSSRGPAHPLAKHLEVAGLRITGERNGAKIQFVVVNHSAADLPELSLLITLRGPGTEPVFEFPYKLPSIGPYESKDASASVKTNLKPYELPDWQVLRAEFQITGE